MSEYKAGDTAYLLESGREWDRDLERVTVMIHYNIDTTENGYGNLTGKTDSLWELKSIILKNGEMQDLVGYLKVDDPADVSICISIQREIGFFIAVTDKTGLYLSLGNKETLNETVDVWGDGLYISKGLFIPISLGWKALDDYINNKKLCSDIKWITPDDIPDDGNYIN